jgi:hypothetical protein
MRAAVLATLMVTTAVPAHAASLNLIDVAQIYCDSVISGRMEPVLELLTDDLRSLIESGQVPILWQGKPEPAEICIPVGNSGTLERPETIVAFGYTAGDKPEFAQTIVMVFIDDTLRIDDVKFEDGTTLRDRLKVRA